MPTSPRAGTPTLPAPDLFEQEAGLKRELSARQMAMIALGGAIGTGLFLGSGLSVQLAGPAVILSYAVGAVIALLITWVLAEMVVAHPVAGSFGVYAEKYLHPWAGFATRYSYWLGQVVATGSEAVAASIYCHLWFPRVAGWVWIAAFSVALVYVNARSVAGFGEFEYWFALIKVVTIAIFVILGGALLLGLGFPQLGFSNYTSHGGFAPNGWRGVGLGVAMAVFSYLGVEIVAVTSGEAKDPERTVPRAIRSMVARLILFYVGSMAVLVGVMPWSEAGLTESPFVRVLRAAGIPAAAAVMNFVVLTAALSSMNCNLYLTSRMIFSLARGGYAPAVFGRLSARGTPVTALLVSSAGMVAALFLQIRFQETAYVLMLGAAFFGGLFVWMLVFVTHLAFRMRYRGPLFVRAPLYPWTSIAGVVALVAVTVSTWWVPGMRITIKAGLPWLVLVSVCYFVWTKVGRRPSGAAGPREISTDPPSAAAGQTQLNSSS